MTNPYESPDSMTTNSNSTDWVTTSVRSAEDTASAVQQFFLAEGYRLEDGHSQDAIYGIGNNLLRILFGAFVKRYRFKVRVVADGSGSRVFVDKGMSGAMGGAIGYAKMKKELARVRDGVRAVLH